MNKVIIINLNGNAYQLEEDAYDALRAYLDTARARLEGNPDRDEILADIEQAIADKFRGALGANKSVVLLNEVKGVIAEMGPVEAAGEAGAAQGAPAAPAPGAKEAPKGEAPGAPRRLYRINDGAMLAGVCNGLAVYVGVDATIVRIVFVILSLLYGFGGLLYLIMAIIIPSATTSDEKAAAFGTPSTTQEFIKRAREGYYEGMKTFRDKREYREWRRKFRREMKGWGHQLKEEMQRNANQWSYNWHQHWEQHGPRLFGAWLLAPFFALASLVVTLAVFYAIYSILVHGAAFGIGVPAGIPHWAAIIILLFLIQFIVWPLKAMRHSVLYGYGPPYYHPVVHFWNGIAGLAVFVVVVWLFIHHPSQVRDAIQNFGHEMRAAFEAFRSWLNTL
jgi:phage shock protein PspC (stress-responsive transcriptional regulator)